MNCRIQLYLEGMCSLTYDSTINLANISPFVIVFREDGEAVRRLLNDLHEKQVEMTKMQLQLNHANLQIEALMGSEQQSRYERDALKFTLASVEQDKLLLEVC